MVSRATLRCKVTREKRNRHKNGAAANEPARRGRRDQRRGERLGAHHNNMYDSRTRRVIGILIYVCHGRKKPVHRGALCFTLHTIEHNTNHSYCCSSPSIVACYTQIAGDKLFKYTTVLDISVG